MYLMAPTPANRIPKETMRRKKVRVERDMIREKEKRLHAFGNAEGKEFGAGFQRIGG